MDIGIGYPGLFDGVDRDLLLRWAIRAEEAGFDCLSSGERLASDTPDLMITMAMAAAVTSRIRLMTTVVLLPLHERGLVTKQAATLDVMSNGRFTLGVGVGHRPQDYAAGQRDLVGRLDRFEDELAYMRRQWVGAPLPGEPAVGPRPTTTKGPRVLIGPMTPRAARRAPLADGIVTFGARISHHKALYDSAVEAWTGAGRQGRPYFAAGAFLAVGPNAEQRCRNYVEWHSSAPVGNGLSRVAIAEDELTDRLREFAALGCDEFYLVPTIAEIDQVDRLAALR